MANTTNTKHTCGDCAFFKDGYCAKRNTQSRAIYYACDRFQTPAELQAYIEQLKKERMDREETRLNFLLTGLYISATATATQHLLEYFDGFFQDAKVERAWRFERKRAAKEMTDCANRMRTLFHHTFGQDQYKVMTAHGKKAFDAEAYYDGPIILLYEAQKFLREEKKLIVLVGFDFCPITSEVVYNWVIVMNGNTVKKSSYTYDYFEEALSEGIKEAVKILKEE